MHNSMLFCLLSIILGSNTITLGWIHPIIIIIPYRYTCAHTLMTCDDEKENVTCKLTDTLQAGVGEGGITERSSDGLEGAIGLYCVTAPAAAAVAAVTAAAA